MLDNLYKIGLTGFSSIFSMFKAAKSDSLIEYTSVTRIEPIVLIDKAVLYSPVISDLQQSLLSMYTMYYLQAVAVDSAIGNVSVHRKLDRLNPNRNVVDTVAGTTGMIMAMENYKESNNSFGFESFSDVLALESKNTNSEVGDVANLWDTKDQNQLANLSVGRLVSATFTDGDKKITVPVQVRMIAASKTSDELVHNLSSGSKDTSLKDRWRGWRSGRLDFIKDLIFMQDLYERRIINGMKDVSGDFREANARSRNNKIAGILSLNPSVATASNMIVLDSNTARELEVTIGGELKSPKFRSQVMEDRACMLVVVVDNDWERCKFYYKHQTLPVEYSFKDIASISKKSDTSDLAQLMKTFMGV